MARRYGNGQGDPKEVIDHLLNRFGRGSRNLLPLLLVLVVGLVLFLAAVQVEPGEVAVVRRLGKESYRLDSGFHFVIPGVDQYDIVNVTQVRRVEVGFRGAQTQKEEAQMLTGDENIVSAQMIVQYRVGNPSQYLFRLANPEATLHSTAEVALRSIIGETTTDDAITKGRGEVQIKTRELLQRLMAQYESGLLITEVKLQKIDPPDQVKDAFHDVVRAREEKEKLINQARGYREEVMPRAEGEAAKQLRDAEGYREQRVLRAQGDAERFKSMQAEYVKAKQTTRDRLYLETMEKVLSKVKTKTVLDSSLSGSALPVLSLGQKAVAAQGVGLGPLPVRETP